MIGIYKGLLAKEENYNVQILKCLNYIEQNDGLEQTENGKYVIEDEDIFVNITEYETKRKKKHIGKRIRNIWICTLLFPVQKKYVLAACLK